MLFREFFGSRVRVTVAIAQRLERSGYFGAWDLLVVVDTSDTVVVRVDVLPLGTVVTTVVVGA